MISAQLKSLYQDTLSPRRSPGVQWVQVHPRARNENFWGLNLVA